MTPFEKQLLSLNLLHNLKWTGPSSNLVPFVRILGSKKCIQRSDCIDVQRDLGLHCYCIQQGKSYSRHLLKLIHILSIETDYSNNDV